MSINLLSNLGLSASLMDAFGFSGTVAAQTFGVEAYNSFVQAQAQLTTPEVANVNTPVTVNTTDLLDLAASSDNVAGTTGQDNSAVNQLLAVDQTLQSQTGAGLNDITVSSVDANGNVTASLNGVEGATNTVNVGDELNNALDQISADQVFGLLAG